MNAPKGPVAAAQEMHREARAHVPVATMTEDFGEGGTYVVRMFADGSTGVLVRRVRVGRHIVLGYVELTDRDTIWRVTAVDAEDGKPVDVQHRQRIGHAALRSTLRTRRRLRMVTAAHARPRRPIFAE